MINKQEDRSNSDAFSGPLFLIGMPRSGTKLLRGLLMQHPRVHFSEIETEFFPAWVAHWESFGMLENPKNFERFCRRSKQLPFFIQNEERGVEVNCQAWFNACVSFTPASVFEALLRCMLDVPHDRTDLIWGDKSPSYIRHVPLLMAQFPNARVIHIIRDARDYCLSINKAWGKNMLRAAQRWQDDVSRCRQQGRDYPSAYMEIRFEDLLADPVPILERICGFIGIQYESRMLLPGQNTENLGDAKGSKGIVASNFGKYQIGMARRKLYEIEKIACETLRSLGYSCGYEGQPMRLPGWKLRVLQIFDGWNLVRSNMQQRGIIRTLKFYTAHARTRS